jgi:hypothetical protein
MIKLLSIIILLALGLLTPGAIHLDGRARGLANAGMMRLDLGKRRLALAFVPYGPQAGGRVYWRLAAGTVTA